jgi:hypothetical protein
MQRFLPYRPAARIRAERNSFRRRAGWRDAAAVDGCRIDPLEPRTLLAFAPAGPEFRVNAFTVDGQESPSVGADAAGNFVVAWASTGEDDSDWGIYARRFNASGAAPGEPFHVNTTIPDVQKNPSVACDADGDFVVAWESYAYGDSTWDVYAQRFDAAGARVGEEFLVNATTDGSQFAPSVSCDADGDFVVAWVSDEPDGGGEEVYARRFDAAGVARAGEFHVNTWTERAQNWPSVACDADGDFIVAWQSRYQDGSEYGVYAQRYSAAGAARGDEFRVNAATAGMQSGPFVASDAAGNFVVAWTDSGPGGLDADVYARRFDAAGVAGGVESRVNTLTANAQYAPSIASNAAGNYVIAWQSLSQDGSYDVFARSYNAAGVPRGAEAPVNTTTAGTQIEPSVAIDADGDSLVAWSGTGPGDADGIFARAFSNTALPAPRKVAQVFVNGAGLTGQGSADGAAFRALAGIDNTFGYSIPGGAGQTMSIPWAGGVDRIALRFTGDVETDLRQPDLVVRGTNGGTYSVTGFTYDAPTKTGVWTLSGPITDARVQLFLDDAAFAGLDGEWTDGTHAFPSGDGAAGGDFAFRFSMQRGDATRDGQVNALDIAFIKQRLLKKATNPGAAGATYSIFADLNSSGTINALDIAAAKQNLNRSLPVFTAPGSASAAAIARGIVRDDTTATGTATAVLLG